jgi:hypothetical protein
VEGATDIQWIENSKTGTQAVVYRFRDRAVLVFRGTEELKDWITDLAFFYAACPPRHAGFWWAWRSVKAQVQAWAAAHHDLPFVIAGHSLGGALATLAAFDLAEDYKIERVTTFGSPRVCSPEFALAYVKRGLGDLTHRYVHVDDGVAVVPPAGLFLAVGTKTRLVRPLEREDYLRQAGFGTPPTVQACAEAVWRIGLWFVSPALGSLANTRPGVFDSWPDWAVPYRASLLRKDWKDTGPQFLAMLVLLAFPFLALYLMVNPQASEVAVSGYLKHAWFARGIVTAFMGLIAQQAAYLVAWRFPFALRFPLSLAAGLVTLRALAFDRTGVWHAGGVVLLALILCLVLYRVVGGVVDHPVELYVVALGGTRRESAVTSPGTISTLHFPGTGNRSGPEAP